MGFFNRGPSSQEQEMPSQWPHHHGPAWFRHRHCPETFQHQSPPGPYFEKGESKCPLSRHRKNEHDREFHTGPHFFGHDKGFGPHGRPPFFGHHHHHHHHQFHGPPRNCGHTEPKFHGCPFSRRSHDYKPVFDRRLWE